MARTRERRMVICLTRLDQASNLLANQANLMLRVSEELKALVEMLKEEG